jgi:hypothetical protein
MSVAARYREALEVTARDLVGAIEDAMVLREEAQTNDGLPDGLVNDLLRIQAIAREVLAGTDER